MKTNASKQWTAALAFALLASALPGRAFEPAPGAFFDGAPGAAAPDFVDSLKFAAPKPPPAKPAPVPAPSPAPSTGQGAAQGRAVPDFAFTPGKLCTPQDPDFKEYRYPEHIAYCNRNVTQQMKQEVAAHYGVPEADWGNYEFDHLIPLAIGGDSHVDNLWPQPRGQNGSDGKDKLEVQLYNQMKAGTVTQADAVKQIYAWFQSAQQAQVPTAPPAGR